MSDRHVVLVLAAGGSRRLGRPKQLLTRDGETLVRRTVRLAIESGAGQVLLVVGARREAIEAAVSGLACEIVVNADWQQGLGSSLRAAAAHITGVDARVLIIPCDLPGLAAADMRALVEGAQVASSGCAATRLGDLVGMPAVVPATWFGTSVQLQAHHGFGARLRALERTSLCIVEAAGLAFDIDTNVDVDAAVSRGWLDPGG